jgi:CRISPR-associated protein Cas6
VPTLCTLSGAKLEINGKELRCGIPEIHQLASSPTLRSRLVIFNIKEARDGALTPDAFLAAVKRRLTELEIEATPELEFAAPGEPGPFARRVLKVKDTVLPGYGIILRHLSETDSLRVQEVGLGAKRRMGCGLFLPLKREE